MKKVNTAESWEIEESPTLREVGAYLKGVADTVASMSDSDRVSGVMPIVVGSVGAPSSRRITLRIGEVALPFEQAVVWPRDPSLRPPSTARGGSRWVELEGASIGPRYATPLPLRHTLPYSAAAVSVCPIASDQRFSLYPSFAEEATSGVRLRLVTLRPEWYDSTELDE